MTENNYVLYSTPVQLRTREVMVPPISMYHLRKILEIRDAGVDIDNPDAAGVLKLLSVIHEMIQENHPDLTYDDFEKQVDSRNLQQLMIAAQSMPKNVTPQTGTMSQTEEATNQLNIEK